MNKRDFVIAYVLARAASSNQSHGEYRNAFGDALLAWDMVPPIELPPVMSEDVPVKPFKSKSVS